MYANTAQAQEVVNRLQAYGVSATGEVVTQEYHSGVDYADQITLAELARRGGRISRVRVLSSKDWGYRTADVSYIHAEVDGKTVPVRLGGNVFTGHLYGPKGLKARMIEWAKEEGVYAKGLGLLDEGNWSVLY